MKSLRSEGSTLHRLSFDCSGWAFEPPLPVFYSLTTNNRKRFLHSIGFVSFENISQCFNTKDWKAVGLIVSNQSWMLKRLDAFFEEVKWGHTFGLFHLTRIICKAKNSCWIFFGSLPGKKNYLWCLFKSEAQNSKHRLAGSYIIVKKSELKKQSLPKSLLSFDGTVE